VRPGGGAEKQGPRLRPPPSFFTPRMKAGVPGCCEELLAGSWWAALTLHPLHEWGTAKKKAVVSPRRGVTQPQGPGTGSCRATPAGDPAPDLVPSCGHRHCHKPLLSPPHEGTGLLPQAVLNTKGVCVPLPPPHVPQNLALSPSATSAVLPPPSSPLLYPACSAHLPAASPSRGQASADLVRIPPRPPGQGEEGQ